jgi:hypothetical protein
MACARRGSLEVKRRSSCFQNIFAKSTRTSPHHFRSNPCRRCAHRKTAPKHARAADALSQCAGPCVSSLSSRTPSCMTSLNIITTAATPTSRCGAAALHGVRPRAKHWPISIGPPSTTNVSASNNSTRCRSNVPLHRSHLPFVLQSLIHVFLFSSSHSPTGR